MQHLQSQLIHFFGLFQNVFLFRIHRVAFLRRILCCYYKIICEKATYYYNISHSKDYVAIVTSENPIGIDIEKTRKIPNYLINYLNNDKEKSYIYQNKYNIYNRFFEIFTLKESYLKMKRNTIFNIKKVILKISNNKLQLNYDKYYYLIKHLNDKYILAICEKK